MTWFIATATVDEVEEVEILRTQDLDYLQQADYAMVKHDVTNCELWDAPNGEKPWGHIGRRAVNPPPEKR